MRENFRPRGFKARAREALAGKWGIGVVVSLIALGVGCGSMIFYYDPTGLMSLGYLLFFSQLVGMGVMFLWFDVSNGAPVEFRTLFEPFSDYWRYFLGGLLVFVFTALWTLLFIVPGIVKSFSYSMTYFIMRDNPEMRPNEARKMSIRMMRGHKWELFCLYLSFLGWAMLCVLTLGVGLLWLYTYMYTSMAEFYKELKKSEVQ